MRIIVPMAGRGSRLRPHTLTVPKPLVPIAGKPIVQHLVEDIAAVCNEPIEEIAFIIGDFGKQVEQDLIAIAENLGAKGTICFQEEALGTAHAILCAEEALQGNVVVAFADTLFKADFKMNTEKDGTLWVKQIEDPSAFGVVKVDENNVITDFVEKPKTFVSDLAMIGIYYFKDGKRLKDELQYLIDNNIIKGGEYQLPDALKNMTAKGAQFEPGQVEEWLDCGNKNATVNTNQRILEFKTQEDLVAPSVKLENSVVVPPCCIGENAVIRNSVVGPHVSIGANCEIQNTRISNSLVQNDTQIEHATIADSMIGNHVTYKGKQKDLSLGDYSHVTE